MFPPTFGCVDERRLAVALDQHTEIAAFCQREHGGRPGRGADARASRGIEGHGVAGDLNPRGRVGLVGAAGQGREILASGVRLGGTMDGGRAVMIKMVLGM